MPSINGVECPECGTLNTAVRFSSHTVDGTRVRQRHCGDCGERFATGEIVLKGHSYHSLTYNNRGKDKSEGPFLKEVMPDEIEVRYLKTGEIVVQVIKGARRGRKMCRRGLHELIEGVTTVDKKPNQCYACRNISTMRYVRKGVAERKAKV